MSIQDFKDMTREQFLGNPTIVPSQTGMRLFEVTGMREVPLEPFLETFKAKISERGAMVYDGAKLIATCRRNKGGASSSMDVDPAFQQQGIGTEIIYQLCVQGYCPTGLNSTIRTAAAQAMCEAVWERIQTELGV